MRKSSLQILHLIVIATPHNLKHSPKTCHETPPCLPSVRVLPVRLFLLTPELNIFIPSSDPLLTGSVTIPSQYLVPPMVLEVLDAMVMVHTSHVHSLLTLYPDLGVRLSRSTVWFFKLNTRPPVSLGDLQN